MGPHTPPDYYSILYPQPQPSNNNNNNNMILNHTGAAYLQAHAAAAAVERRGNLNVFEMNDAVDAGNNIMTDGSADSQPSSTTPSQSNTEVALCHLVLLLPFSADGVSPWNGIGNYEGAAAVSLAVQHLNERSSRVVGGDGNVDGSGNNGNADANSNTAASSYVLTDDATLLPALGQTCPSLKFSLELADTVLQESVAVNHVIDITDRKNKNRAGQSGGNNDAGGDDSNFNNTTTSSIQMPPPCAILGAARSAVSIPTSLITGLRGYPQISAISTSVALDDATQYPLFGRTIPGDDGTAIPVVLYLRQRLQVRYLAILNVNDAYGNAYALGLQVAAQEYAPDLQLQQLTIRRDATAEEIQQTISFLAETQYTTFFGIFSGTLLDPIMTEAVAQGIAGTGRHNWIFSDALGSAMVNRAVPRTLGRAFQGAGLVAASAGLPGYSPPLDALTAQLQALKESPADLDYLTSIFPKFAVPKEEGSDDTTDYNVFDVNQPNFLTTPGLMGPFLYDATIALGLAACQAWSDNQLQQDIMNFGVNTDNAPSQGVLDGKAHFDAMVTRDPPIAGTSGVLQFDPITGTRDPRTAFFTLTNHVVDTESPNTNETHVQYKQVLTDIFSQGAWQELAPFVFNDGTTNIPDDLPPVASVEQNHLPAPLRVAGLSMCGVTLFTAACMAVWTLVNSQERVVKASQPLFLLIVCGGVAIFMSTIIPLSMDTGVTTTDGCDAACSSIPWLLSIGFSAIFSALFTKTRRINKIFHNPSFRRIRVTAMDVMVPMLVLQGLNIVVLASWTAVAPLEWTLQVQETDDFGRPTNVLGYCSSDQLLPFLIPLVLLNLSALVFAVYQAYAARQVSTEFAESEYIFKAMLSILLVCFIGIPVLILAHENPDAFFFVFTGILFVTSMSILLLIFVPKMQFMHAKKKRGKSSRVFVSNFSTNNGSNDQHNNHHSSDLRFTSHAESVVSDDDQEGLVVLSTKTQEELIQENKQLRRRLLALNANTTNNASSSSISNGASRDFIVPDHPATTVKFDDEDENDVTTNSGAKVRPKLAEKRLDLNNDDHDDDSEGDVEAFEPDGVGTNDATMTTPKSPTTITTRTPPTTSSTRHADENNSHSNGTAMEKDLPQENNDHNNDDNYLTTSAGSNSNDNNNSSSNGGEALA